MEVVAGERERERRPAGMVVHPGIMAAAPWVSRVRDERLAKIRKTGGGCARGRGIWGVEDIHLPPLHHVPPYLPCSAPLHPTGFTVPTYISCREGKPPSSSCPLLKFNFTLLLSPSTGPFSSRFLSVPGVVRTRPFSLFLRPSQENAKEREKSETRGRSRSRGEPNRGEAERGPSHETSRAEENTNLILRVIHLGRHRSGLSPVICIFTSICFVLIVRAPRALLFQRRK